MAPDPDHCDVVLQAAIDGNLRLLTEMATKVNLREAKDAKGRNALHFAASEGRLEICSFLVEESGLDVNSTSAEGETPVLFAAAGGNESLLRYLLDRGCDPRVPDNRGSTPLHWAAENGHCEAVKLLLSKGVDVDPLNYGGMPLHLAAAKDRDQIVKILLEHGADPNKVANLVFSPLMMACCGHSLKCMKLLVEAGADVNFRGPSGPSILMEAVDDGLTDIVKFLLEAQADPNIIEEAQDPVPMEEDVAYLKAQGKEAFAKGEYLAAIYFYGLAIEKDPVDATLVANTSLCWLRMREGERALLDARQCRMMCPRWSKAWYREGAALSLLKNYKGAVDAFLQALKLDPASEEIKKALREAMETMKSATRSQELNS